MNTPKTVMMAGWLLALMVVLACDRGAVPAQNEDSYQAQTEPQVVSASIQYTAFYGAATASLEERIHFSDIVARATLISTSSSELRFRAVEYLKGSGPAEFAVSAGPYKVPLQGQGGSESVLFLTTSGQADSQAQTGLQGQAGSSSTFGFTDTTTIDYGKYSGYDATYSGDLPLGNTPGSNNPVWLPQIGSSTGAASGASGASVNETEFITDASPGQSESITLSELRETVSWVVGDGSRDYRGCVQGTLKHRRHIRDWEEYHNEVWEVASEPAEISSGQRRGTAIHNYRDMYEDPKLEDVWLSGEDTDLFASEITDSDNDSATRYDVVVSTKRPLPAGYYMVVNHLQPAGYRDTCDGVLVISRLQWNITVTAPPGTVHEAFFDPVTTTAGVGYAAGPATTTGVLKPAAFSTGSATTTITGLNWQSGSVVLSLSPFASLGNNQLSFIDLDGSFALALGASDATADSAAGTLTWAVPDSPWSAGDQLMLRIGPAPDARQAQ